MSSRPRIAITLGDVAGIGPEIVTKALRSGKLDKRFEYEIIGNPRTKRRQDAVSWVVEAATRCQQGELAGMVTAPISKALIRQAGYRFEGHTELLAYLTRTEKYAMMLVGGPLRVALATIHQSLRSVPDRLTGQRIVEVINLTHAACRDFGLAKPRIGVAALNPHGGEDGLMGDEEERIIAPAIKTAARKLRGVTGPHPADTLFHKHYKGDFDAVVAMYHDQGLVPLKMIAFDTGVNLTLGLPIVRTSPDHGTAPDIAGKGIANPGSMIAAINLAAKLAAAKRR
jgi:4-hydroxythreonine-4-phosphate dehydrogenase